MHRPHQQLHQGFSLVEFVVILSLFAIMASVVTFDFQNFRNNIDRSNLATDIALAFRQMQVYGISSSNRQIGGSSFDEDSDAVQDLVNANLIQDTASYGVQVDIDEQTITLFQEVTDDPHAYDVGEDILIDVLNIGGTNRILKVCATEDVEEPRVNADSSCVFDNPGLGEEIISGTFTAMFKRPFPDAVFDGSDFPVGFEPNIVLMMVGPEGQGPDELRYVYFDAVGLIQNITPVIE